MTKHSVLGGKYRLEELLGEGTTGKVFRAIHLDLKRPFALKALKCKAVRGSRALARFRQEAEALGRLQHPNIVDETDFGVDTKTGTAYLVLEYLKGRSLAELLHQEGPLPLERALPLLASVAAAVDAAHSEGVLHRDLKPANVFLEDRPGSLPRVKVLDFGLAELVGAAEPAGLEPAMGGDAALTPSGALPGTPHYAAPEVIREQRTSPASDVYSLGVLAYELLAGRPPFRGTIPEVLDCHLEREPPPIPGLAPKVEQVLLELLDKDPARRPPSATAAVERLEKAAGRARLAAFRKTEMPRRLALSALLALILGAVALVLPSPALPALEGAFADWRSQLARPRAPDPRLLLVVLDEATLDKNGAALADPLWADELGRLMTSLFAAGARGVAVDLVPPPAWSASRDLAAAIVRHADAVTLALSSEGERVFGPEFLADGVVEALGLKRARELFAFINFDQDPDGTVRHGRRTFLLEEDASHPSLAEHAVGRLGLAPPLPDGPRRFWIDSRVRWQDYPVVSWSELSAHLAARPGEFAGKVVLFGGTWTGSRDRHRFGGHGEVSGLVLHALMIDSLAAGPPVEVRTPLVVLGTVLLTGLGIAGVLTGRRPGQVVLILVVGFACYLGVSLWSYSAAGIVAPVTLPGLVLAGGVAAAWILRLRLPPYPEGA